MRSHFFFNPIFLELSFPPLRWLAEKKHFPLLLPTKTCFCKQHRVPLCSVRALRQMEEFITFFRSICAQASAYFSEFSMFLEIPKDNVARALRKYVCECMLFGYWRSGWPQNVSDFRSTSSRPADCIVAPCHRPKLVIKSWKVSSEKWKPLLMDSHLMASGLIFWGFVFSFYLCKHIHS